jgi:NADH dehydrogenase
MSHYPPLHAVTGAFGYCGRHITDALIESGCVVRNLTGHPDRSDPFGGRVQLWPLDFEDPGRLREALTGVEVLFNTYWIRFEHGGVNFDDAVRNSKRLITSAVRAGVRRIVHVSITNPDADSPLLYFRGKALVEQAIMESGLSYAVLRPALFFGGDDILINNIAWLLRRSPVLGIAGSGGYPLQPIHIDDFAWLAVELARGSDDVVVDAVGPEIWSYEELVRIVRASVNSRSLIISMEARTLLAAARILGRLLQDVILTPDEIEGLMAGLLATDGVPNGHTRLSLWLREHGPRLGRRYASELERHFSQTTTDPRAFSLEEGGSSWSGRPPSIPDEGYEAARHTHHCRGRAHQQRGDVAGNVQKLHGGPEDRNVAVVVGQGVEQIVEQRHQRDADEGDHGQQDKRTPTAPAVHHRHHQ